MSHSLLFFNCSDSIVNRIRSVLAEQISTMVCESWHEVCDVLKSNQGHGLVAELGESPAEAHRPDDSAPIDHSSDHSSLAVAIHHRQVTAVDSLPPETTSGTLADQIDEWERRIIAETLRKNRNHRKETAAMLGISRVTLYNKMKKFGMLE